MRKLILSFSILLSLTFVTSCGGGGVKGDAKKMASLMCEMIELQKDPDKNKEKLEEIAKKGEKLQKEMEEKYKDKKDDEAMKKEMQEVLMEELKACGAPEAMIEAMSKGL